MAFVPTAVPWSHEHQIQSLQVTRKQLETEEQAASPLGGASPRYLYLASKQNNKWGHPRGYRIQTVSFAGGALPQNSSMERAFSWARWVMGYKGGTGGGGWCKRLRVAGSPGSPPPMGVCTHSQSHILTHMHSYSHNLRLLKLKPTG